MPPKKTSKGLTDKLKEDRDLLVSVGLVPELEFPRTWLNLNGVSVRKPAVEALIRRLQYLVYLMEG